MAQHNTNKGFLILADETAWGDGGAGGNDALIPMLDAEYGVELEDPSREQPHVQGNVDANYQVQDGRNLRGPLRVGAWSHNWKRLLDWATVKTGGELDSKAATYAIPGLDARKHDGLKVDSLSIEGSDGGDVTFGLDLIGRADQSVSVPAYPGSWVIPASHAMLYKNCRFVVSLDAGSTFANRIAPVGLQSFAINIQNALNTGPAQEDRVNGYLDGIIEYLTAGRQSADCRFTAAFDRADYSTLQRDRLYAQFKLVGAHPAWTTYFTVDAAGATAGSAVTVPLTTDPTGDVSVNDYVFFDNAGGTNLPCVGKVTAVTATDVTIDVLDEDVVSGDHLFLAGFEVKTERFRCTTSPIGKSFGDFLTREVQGTIEATSTSPVSYKCNDWTLP